MDERKRRILRAVIDAYVRTGEPVGSKSIMDMTELSVSSATIRNEMSDLERLGLLSKTHTSSGRVPSEMGYRYYVRTSLGDYELTQLDINELSPQSRSYNGIYDAVREAAARLAEFSGCTVFALAPTSVGGVYTFDVMPAGRKTLAILAISANGSVKTCFATLDEEVDENDAATLIPILNSILSGFPAEKITEIRFTIIEEKLKASCPKLLKTVSAIRALVSQLQSYELEIGGSTNLLSYPEFSDIEIAREYIALLSRREAITDLLIEEQKSAENEDGFTIKIGGESSLKLPNASVMSMRCGAKIPVILCAIGPTRMDYARLKAGLDFISDTLRAIIDDEF